MFRQDSIIFQQTCFEEERELTVMLLVDISASSLFGTVFSKKKILSPKSVQCLLFPQSITMIK